MKKLLLTLALIFLCLSGGETSQFSRIGNTTTSYDKYNSYYYHTLAQVPTEGNLIIAGVTVGESGTHPTVKDNLDNFFTEIINGTSPPSAGRNYLFYEVVPAGINSTLNITYPGTNANVMVQEYGTGNQTVSLNATAAGYYDYDTVPIAWETSNVTAEGLLIGYASSYYTEGGTAPTWTNGTGWGNVSTQYNASNDEWNSFMEEKLNMPSATYNASGIYNSSSLSYQEVSSFFVSFRFGSEAPPTPATEQDSDDYYTILM